MKKYLLLVFVFMLVACSSNDDSSNDTNDPIDNNDNDNNDTGVNDYLIPFVYTDHAQRVSLTTATLNGTIELSPMSVGDFQVGNSNEFETKGFVWGTESNPNLDDSNVFVADNNNEGYHHLVLENLSQETEYFYRAYATNLDDDLEYGQIRSFTTHGPSPCNPSQDNRMDIGVNFPIDINNVNVTDPPGFNDGNLQFETTSYSSNVRIIVQLDEIDMQYPLTGLYTTIWNFDNQTIESTNQAKVAVVSNGLTTFAAQGQCSFYVEYIPNDRITFIFCNSEVGNNYNLNGKFTVEL